MKERTSKQNTQTVKVFVYGSLRATMYNNPRLNGELIAMGHVRGFNCFHTDAGYPITLPAKNNRKVVGEVYRLPSSELNSLDGFEGNGFMYQRIPVDVWTTTGKKINAWMYVGILETWSDRIESEPIPNGDWVKYIRRGN
jgi:gamma-glutamylcyclotransferase (GGCT)/AIG2-like uncharacterized protein YtfP